MSISLTAAQGDDKKHVRISAARAAAQVGQNAFVIMWPYFTLASGLSRKLFNKCLMLGFASGVLVLHCGAPSGVFERPKPASGQRLQTSPSPTRKHQAVHGSSGLLRALRVVLPLRLVRFSRGRSSHPFAPFHWPVGARERRHCAETCGPKSRSYERP